MKYTNFNKNRPNKKKRAMKTRGIALSVLLAVLVISIVTAYLFREKIAAVFDPIAIVASVAAADLEETDGRTNVLLLGSDKRGDESVLNKPTLTDSLLVASIGRVDNDVVLISLPRDLWVNWIDTKNQKRYSKINAIYPVQYGGVDQLLETTEGVLGIPVHYYMLVNFDLFEESIDILEGIEITVDRTFTDRYYPIEGKERAIPVNERYETIRFNAGAQVMSGKTALKFVRSRKGDNNEGTDFARSKRQQKVIASIKDKALSIRTLINPSKIKNLYETYIKNVDTNIDFSTIQGFYLLSQQVDLNKVVSIVLDDRSQAVEGGLLYAPEDTKIYGGAYVLIPQTGDYSQIHAYVQKYIFGDK